MEVGNVCAGRFLMEEFMQRISHLHHSLIIASNVVETSQSNRNKYSAPIQSSYEKANGQWTSKLL